MGSVHDGKSHTMYSSFLNGANLVDGVNLFKQISNSRNAHTPGICSFFQKCLYPGVKGSVAIHFTSTEHTKVRGV